MSPSPHPLTHAKANLRWCIYYKISVFLCVLFEADRKHNVHREGKVSRGPQLNFSPRASNRLMSLLSLLIYDVRISMIEGLRWNCLCTAVVYKYSMCGHVTATVQPSCCTTRTQITHACFEPEEGTCLPMTARLKGAKMGMWCTAKEQIKQQTVWINKKGPGKKRGPGRNKARSCSAVSCSTSAAWASPLSCGVWWRVSRVMSVSG